MHKHKQNPASPTLSANNITTAAFYLDSHFELVIFFSVSHPILRISSKVFSKSKTLSIQKPDITFRQLVKLKLRKLSFDDTVLVSKKILKKDFLKLLFE